MWEEVPPDDRTTLLRCAAIVSQMRNGYARVNVNRVQVAMCLSGVRVFFYRDGNFQLVLALQWSAVFGRWILVTLGFFGGTAQQSAGVMAEFLHDFMVVGQVDTVYSLCRRSAVTLPLMTDLKLDPQLRIVVRSVNEFAEDWTIELPIQP